MKRYDRRPLVTVATIDDLQRVVGELAGDTAYITTQKDGFAIAVPKLQDALMRMVRVSADAAISSVVGFGDALLKPYKGRKTVARKRGLALRAQREFRTVHEHTREALALVANLSVEVTYWRERMEDCTRGVNECRAIASRFADAAEAQFAQTQELIAAAQGDCARVEEAYRSAKQNQSRLANVRTGRYYVSYHLIILLWSKFLFRLGINLRFEIPALDEAIEATEKSKRIAQENLAAVEAQRDAARAQLDAWHAEQRAIEDLSTRLQALGPPLSLAERTLGEHRTKFTDGANSVLDVGVFFGGLVARTAEWGVITSAPVLAETVVELQQLLETNTRLTGVFITSPTLLNDELKLLADSNVQPDSLSALM
jgi:chromosome segregation ATPase